MTDEKKSFESQLARLDELVRLLERGDVSLDDSLKLFEEGAGLVADCAKMLEDAEQRVTKLRKGEDGSPEELPFDDEDQR